MRPCLHCANRVFLLILVMLLTDTHTHIYYETDPEKQSQLMQRCFDNQIRRLFLPNVDVSSVAKIDSLVARYPENCFAMAGLHPCDVKEDYKVQLEQIEASMDRRKIYAIGEIGIDLHWDQSTLAMQQEAFRIQINWARTRQLPFVIHCREAFEEVFAILDQEQGPDVRGIFHCFTGNLEQAHHAISLGFYLGIGGVVTYKKAGLDAVLAEIDLDHIVLETDAPYLAPVPHRGKPNESSYLLRIAQRVSEIYQLPLEQIAEVTTVNSKKVFGI